jgi:hypothetical protein
MTANITVFFLEIKKDRPGNTNQTVANLFARFYTYLSPAVVENEGVSKV